MTDRIPLQCSCCPRPFAELIRHADGTVEIIIQSRHDSGIKHTNVLTIQKIEQMAKACDKVGV